MARTKPLTAAPIPHEDRLITAIEELNESIPGLAKRLADTEAASRETQEWRTKAEKALHNSKRWQRFAVLVLAAAIVVVGGVNHRDDVRQHRSDLHGCQARNDAAQTTRDLFAGIFDSIDHLGTDAKQFTNPLRELLTESAKKDRDCNNDGHLNSLDYPPTPQAPAKTKGK